jgi:hypothetical protein
MKKSQIRTPPSIGPDLPTIDEVIRLSLECKRPPAETALLCRIEPLQSDGLPERHGLKGIFEQQSVIALRAFKCADIAKYSVQRIRGTYHRIFALGAVGPGHKASPCQGGSAIELSVAGNRLSIAAMQQI